MAPGPFFDAIGPPAARIVGHTQGQVGESAGMRGGTGSAGRRGVLAPALIALTLCTCAGLSVAADTAGSAGPAKAPTASPKPARPAPIDINSASKAQLKTLPGIGDAEAGRIVAGRPYLSKADLASKDALPLGIYLQIKDRIVAVQKRKPKAGK
jgi:hypothetical protein